MGARGVVAGLASLILFASCGGGSGDENVTRNNPAPPEIAGFVEAFCQAARSCCGRSAFGDQELADCEAEFVRQTDLAALFARGTLTVDAAALDTCIAAYRRAATECISSDELRQSCTARIFRGTVAEGKTCDRALECWNGDGDWVCLKASNSEIGVCRRAPRGRSGDACFRTCDASDDPCLTTYTTSEAEPAYGVCMADEGLFCAFDSCTPVIAEGAPCSDDEACGPARYCNGACTPRKPAGEACADFSECAPPLTCLESRCTVPPIATKKLCSGDLN